MDSSINCRHSVFRLLIALVLLLIGSAAASAYTIVMFGGRHLQIPDQFAITRTTLTYSVGSTISATLLMAAIDIPATERANNEAPGSFLKRAEGRLAVPEVPQSAGVQAKAAGHRTITNMELLPYEQKRIASEAAYEKRRLELGLPSLAESRRRTLSDEESLTRIAAAEAINEQQSEEYWRSRASALRESLIAIDGQINFLQTRLDELPASPLIGSVIIGNGPFLSSGRARLGSSFNSTFGPSRNLFVSPPGGAPVSGPGITNRPRNFLNPGVPRPGFRGNWRPTTGFSAVPFIGSFGTGDDLGYDDSSLRYELDRLLTTRAGLEASQRELVEEARRAGAQPGWLRP
jgi:hypothetical protein